MKKRKGKDTAHTLSPEENVHAHRKKQKASDVGLG